MIYPQLWSQNQHKWGTQPAANAKPLLSSQPLPEIPYLSPKEALALEKKPLRSPWEQQALDYYQIEQWYGQPVTPELYQFDNSGRQRKRLEFLESILPPILTPEFTLLPYPTSPDDTLPTAPLLHLLYDIQFYPFLSFALSGGEWYEQTPILRHFFTNALTQQQPVYSRTGIKIAPEIPPCTIAGRFLDQCGLKTVSSQCRRLVTLTGALLKHPSGKKQDPTQPTTLRVRIYRLHPELLNQTWSILHHRHLIRHTNNP